MLDSSNNTYYSRVLLPLWVSERKVLVANNTRLDIANARNHTVSSWLDDTRETGGHELHTRHKVLAVKGAVSANRCVVNGLHGINLIGAHACIGGYLLVGADGLWDGAL